MLNFPLLN